jgi:hypothetical protein
VEQDRTEQGRLATLENGTKRSTVQVIAFEGRNQVYGSKGKLTLLMPWAADAGVGVRWRRSAACTYSRAPKP